MRINSKLLRVMVAAALGLGLWSAGAPAGFAQTTQKQFGPRVKPAGQAPAAGQAPPAGQPQAPAVEVIATHGSWKIQCENSQKGSATEGQTEGTKQCGMVQGAQSEKNPKATLTLVIVKSKQGDKVTTMMRVIAPIGVFLPTGVALEIDGTAVGRVPFTRCMPQICMAFAEASPETLAKMKKGNEANFIIYEAPGLGLPMKLSLDGFSNALAELDKL